MSNSIDRNVKRKDGFKTDQVTKVKKGEPPIFSWVEMSLSGLCNRFCEFCPRVDPKSFPNVNKHMSIEVYSKMITDLRKVNYKGGFIYSGFSEPILYKYLIEAIKLTRKYLPNNRIEIVTNGDHILKKNKIIENLFEAGLSQLSVSLYDGPHQVKQFEELRKKYNFSKDEFDIRYRWLPKEDGYGQNINLTNRAGIISIPEINVKKLNEPLKKKCFYPFYQVMIDYDGDVLLCNHDWHKKMILGNINKESLLEIWNNNVYEKTRKFLSQGFRKQSPCSECDANGTMMGEEYFKKWITYYENRK